MISRKSAKLIAEVYDVHFLSSLSSSTLGTTYTFKQEELIDFLYEEEYESWFLNVFRALAKILFSRSVKDLIMKLHTGETQFNATPDWSWEQRQTLGQRYLKDLAEDIIKLYERLPETDVSRFKSLAPSIDLNKLRFSAKPAHALVNRMKAQLELDGYLFREGILYKTESTVIDEQEEQSYLNLLIDSSLLNDPATIKHHVKLAEEHYVNGKWGDSIANSRNFLEAILVQVANAINVVKYGSNLSTDVAGRAVEVRTYLEKENVVEAKEKEAIGKVYGLLSDTGSHPNIAERDQARLMWHLALTFSQFVLLRYQGLLKKSGDVPA